MSGRRVCVLALLGAALLLLVDSAAATPGALDPGFGLGGTVTTTLGSGSSQAGALVVQWDGKILVGGETLVGSELEFALARYNLDGSLDASFGSGGKVTTAIGSQFDLIRALLLQPDGKIVAAGGSYDGSAYDFALARYNTDGSLDTSFGAGGKVITPIAASGGGEASAITLQTDGKFVVGGASHDSGDFVIARYNPNGTLDATFGTGGIVMTAAGYVHAVAVQADGKVVAAGGCCINPSKVAVARYNPDGTLDTSFGTGGIVTITPAAAQQGEGNGLVLQADGKLVVGGEANGGFALVRLNTDGTLDTSFGEGGSVITPIGGTYRASGQALVRQSDGDLVLAGYARPVGAPADEFALARYDANGSLDAGFGTGGTVSTLIGANGSVGEAVAVESNGKIVVGGFTESADPTGVQFALARYLVTNTLTVFKSGDGSGLVASSPSGIDCGSTCTASFTTGPVTLTATPAVGSTFTGWQPGAGCTGTGSCQVQMSNDQSVTATFSRIPERLTVIRSGLGSGKVTSSPSGISCGYTCSHAYGYGTTVTLRASSGSGSTFKGWSGACSGTGTCSLTMKQTRSATATFAAKPCIVPNVKGKSLKRARRSITRAHCRTGKVSRQYSTVGRGDVVSQKPHPKRHLHSGAKVNLVISKGRRP